MLVRLKKQNESQLSGRGSVSNSEVEGKAWTTLWNTMVPGKIKTFLWRLAKQSLATEDVRRHRNRSTTDCCPLCSNGDSWVHSLLECSLSRCVWALVRDSFSEVLSNIKEPNAKLWFFQVQEECS